MNSAGRKVALKHRAKFKRQQAKRDYLKAHPSRTPIATTAKGK